MSDTRIRLEGRLETVEQSIEALDALHARARASRWQADPGALLERLTQWEHDAPRREEALAAVAAHGELAGVRRAHAWARTRLSRSLAYRYAPLRVGRTLEERLAKWRELVEPFIGGHGPLLLEGECRLRVPHFWKAMGASVTLFASPLPWPIGLGAFIVTFGHIVYSMRPATFRLYERFLELQDLGAAPFRIPHRSLRRVDLNYVYLDLEGLWKVTLVTDNHLALNELALKLNRLKALP